MLNYWPKLKTGIWLRILPFCEILKIINPNQYICTITDSSDFYLEVDIERGKGYRLVDEIRKKAKNEKVIDSKPSTLLVDAIFMPIKKVNYKIKLIHHYIISESFSRV